MLRLSPVVQNYAWGKIGSDSTVCQLYRSGSTNTNVSETLPYAELWMGTHPNGPSVVETTDGPVLLSDWLQLHGDAAGKFVKNGKLPYLFKVLSVNTALSVQAHPDKALARELHGRFPDIYKDDNHKPEMCIALTTFEALCQFRPMEEILHFVETVPELRRLVPSETTKNLKTRQDSESLRAFFTAYVNADPVAVEQSLDEFSRRCRASEDEDMAEADITEQQRDQEIYQIVERLIEQYPGDFGVFAPFLLNYIKLSPGEGIFLAANEPHAYLSGDCIECMACSDNVVRAGLTPKFIDKATLCSMLTYKCAQPSILRGEAIAGHLHRYAPPIEDFSVDKVIVPPADTETSGGTKRRFELPKRASPQILIVISGQGSLSDPRDSTRMPLGRGSVVLIGAGETVTIAGKTNEEELLTAFVASVNESATD